MWVYSCTRAIPNNSLLLDLFLDLTVIDWRYWRIYVCTYVVTYCVHMLCTYFLLILTWIGKLICKNDWWSDVPRNLVVFFNGIIEREIRLTWDIDMSNADGTVAIRGGKGGLRVSCIRGSGTYCRFKARLLVDNSGPLLGVLAVRNG